ncbi:MAG: glycoside hydrolase domain-containing protein, partial [Christensenellaceae bacterium]
MELYILSNTVKHRFGDSFGRGTRLSLVGARGERVAFQAILPKPFHNAFAEADGEWDAEIFWERYVKLSASSSGVTAEREYPDVMVDASRAEKFKDNTSERGEGVLWCFVTIPADAAAGRHTVRLEVTADEGKVAVEAEIEVLDFCLPEQNGNVTSFAIREDMIKSADPGEFRKKYDELVEEHLHYRLSPTKLLPYGTWGIEEALSEARKRTADVRCAAYSLPYKTFREDTIYEKGQECLDTDYLRKLLTAFAENSTDECDLLKKANFYITFIDEPAPERFHSVRRVYREIHDLKREVAKSVDFTGRRGVENSLLTLDNIVTVFNKEPIYGEVDTWCPTYWGYFKPEYVYEEKKLRGLGKKNWWYGCVAPKTPFPNLHTDSPMRDSRFESWLRFLYDISGNLYWATNLTKKYDEKAREYTDCDVLKETLLFPGACGDGLLFYT